MKAKKLVKTKISIKNNSEEVKNGFDKGIDFEETRKIFRLKIKELLKDLKGDYNVHKVKALSNIVIALISLVNGSRISESIEAVFKFVDNKNLTKVLVPIAKRKDGEMRIILLPKEINREILEYIQKFISGAEAHKLQSKVRTYLTDNYGFNTHSLRYAAINYLITEQKQPLNVVSKLVGHKSMNMLINYTQNKNVSSTLESMNSGKF